eukprot:CAMPEP_0175605496 /NCGR_PEP_ID=MMETSP0096-20121207/60234_1 /TAXON_ID=311494 /ORGANISM="Alexandrium monilatum, Strain CCMP3105" /LENGTH=108 /DNA_ID=CAMNT_0016910305 /DNA_START=190 /DNA_END=512 /DNA_ORIENTATION=-
MYLTKRLYRSRLPLHTRWYLATGSALAKALDLGLPPLSSELSKGSPAPPRSSSIPSILFRREEESVCEEPAEEELLRDAGADLFLLSGSGAGATTWMNVDFVVQRNPA